MLGAASADTDVFRDTLRPGGHDRSTAAKFADARRCGATRQNTVTDGPAFQQCMQSRGWVLDHVVADRSATFIDPDTGLSCNNQGGASFCESPQGAVKYTNKHGLSRTRIDEYLFEPVARPFIAARPPDSRGRGRAAHGVTEPAGRANARPMTNSACPPVQTIRWAQRNAPSSR
jgi:hypothetical protein